MNSRAASDHICNLILEVIPKGRANAITAKQITALTGIGERSIQKAIEKLRCRKYMIVAALEAPFGYFMPLDREEALEWDRQLSKRIQTQCIVRAFVRQGFQIDDGQEHLELTGS